MDNLGILINLLAANNGKDLEEVLHLTYKADFSTEVMERAYEYVAKHASEFIEKVLRACNNYGANWDVVNLVIKTGPIKTLNTIDELKSIERPQYGTLIPFTQNGNHYILVLGTETKEYNISDENCYYTKYQLTEELVKQTENLEVI